MPDAKPHAYIQPITVKPRISRPQPKGLPLIHLGFNEVPYSPSPAVMSAIQAATNNANSYGNPKCEQLRTALGNTYQLGPNRMVCGNGSEELLDIIGRCFAGVGDEILISEYGYILFAIVAHRVGATLIKTRESNFTTSVDHMLAAVTDKTRVVFIANPNNPTGTMVSAAELRRLAQGLPSHTVLVLDLAYSEFAGSDYIADVHSIAAEFDNVVITHTFSKAYGLAGLRVGWCYAPEWMVPILYAARGMGTVNAAAQAGATAALAERETMWARVESIIAEKERVAGLLADLGCEVIPSETNFLLVAPPKGDGAVADQLADYLFDEAGIIVNQAREAGLERFIRFSLSLPEHNTALVECVRRFLA